jgi:hypothetical protein
MTIEIIKCEQNSDAWYRARMGIPTASEFSTILAKGKDGKDSKTRKSYLYRLAGEIITGEPGERFTTPAMERGHAMEGEARALYAFQTNADPLRVGFVRNGGAGCSPDALIGDVGGLEIKTKRADILIECLFRDDFPPEHKAQCQGFLWIAEREWIDLCAYWPGMPLYVKRAYRDEAYIEELASAVATFNDELAATVERVRRIGGVA